MQQLRPYLPKLTPTRALLFLPWCVITILFVSLVSGHSLLLNPDGISYLDHAKEWSTGNLSEAISGYWSPGYSLFLSPLQWFYKQIHAARIGTLIISLFWITTTYLLGIKILKNSFAALVAACLLFLSNQIADQWLLVTPDLFLGVWVNIFMLLILGRQRSTYDFLYSGIWIGIGFLLKPIVVPIGAVFLLALVTCKVILPKPALKIFLFSLLIPLIWACVLNVKYGHFTFGTSGVFTYRYSVLGEPFPQLLGPIEPLSGRSYWSDPVVFEAVKFNVNAQFEAIKKNIVTTSKYLFLVYHLGLLLIIFNFWTRRKDGASQILLLFIASWILVYIFILVEGRYLWGVHSLLILLLVQAFKPRLKFLYVAIICVSLILFLKTYTKALPQTNEELVDATFSNMLPENCIVFSDDWARGLRVAYFAHCQYWGLYSNDAHQEFIKRARIKSSSVFMVAYISTYSYLNESVVLTIPESGGYNTLIQL